MLNLLALALLSSAPLSGVDGPFKGPFITNEPPPGARRVAPSAERKPGARAAAELKRQKRQARNLRNRRAAA